MLRFLPSRLTGAITAALLLAITSAPAAGAEKTSVKAAMVYNILRFISFPDGGDRMRLCAVASDSIAGDLRALSGRTVGSARLEVILVRSAKDMGQTCHVMYLEDGAPADVGTPGRNQVLIGDGKSFAERGGTVGLINFGGQVRFVINDRTAKRSGVRFSAQLMQLAAKVVS